MTGLLSPTEGNAWVGGNDIEIGINKVHEVIGVCPQFDLLWPDLTIQEHLFFYARLKGVSRKEETDQVLKILEQVRLREIRKKRVKELSGGMKRRLSIAIALIEQKTHEPLADQATFNHSEKRSNK